MVAMNWKLKRTMALGAIARSQKVVTWFAVRTMVAASNGSTWNACR